MLLIIIYIISTVTGLILIKMGGNNLSFSLINSNLNFSVGLKSLLGLIFYIISFLLWMIILSKPDIKLSLIFPIVTAIVQTLIIISGVLIFKEKVTFIQIIGILFVFLGITLIAYNKG